MNDSSKAGRAYTRRVLLASLVGTAVEFYDFYIYATAASLVFGPLFFPSGSATAQLLSSYATFALAFVARPVGGWIFGHFGDRIGRKSTLVASLLLMGGSTIAIGFLPTYASVGWIAPLLLCILRFGQGLGLGGEWGGAAILAVENAPPGWRARYGMFPQLGAPLGFLVANGLFLGLGLLLGPQQFRDWGWRLPFIASAGLVAVGLWVRLTLVETPAFAKALAEAPPADIPLLEVLTGYPRQVIGGIFGVIAVFAIYYVMTAFALGYGVSTLHYARNDFLEVQLGAIGFMAVGIVASAYLADATDSRRAMMLGCVVAIIASFLLAPMMAAGTLLPVWAFLSLGLLAMGLVYGPIGAFLPGLFPARVRYTGASMAFNLGGVLGGGLTPFIALSLAQHGGLASVGYYVAGAALVSLLALLPLTYQVE